MLQLRADQQSKISKHLIPEITQQVETSEQYDQQQRQWQCIVQKST